MLIQRVQMPQQNENIRQDVIIDFENKPRIVTILSDPLHSHNAFIGQIAIGIKKRLLHNVLINLVLELQQLTGLFIGLFGVAHHENQPHVAEHRTPRPSLTKRQTALEIIRRRVHVDEKKDRLIVKRFADLVARV